MSIDFSEEPDLKILASKASPIYWAKIVEGSNGNGKGRPHSFDPPGGICVKPTGTITQWPQNGSKAQDLGGHAPTAQKLSTSV